MNMENAIERAAIHESAHAVVAHATGHVVKAVTVDMDRAGRGATNYDTRETSYSGVVLVAGMVGEMLAGGDAGRAEYAAKEDLKHFVCDSIVDVLPHITGSEGGSAREVRGAARRSTSRALAVAEIILRARWGAVKAVAELLRSGGTLSGGDFLQMVALSRPETLAASTERLAVLVRGVAGIDPPVSEKAAKMAARVAVKRSPRKPRSPSRPYRRVTRSGFHGGCIGWD